MIAGLLVVLGLLVVATPLATPAMAVVCEPSPGAIACTSYGDHPRQVIDVFAHAQHASEPRPAVLFIHGGGWSTGDKAQFAAAATQTAQKGWVGFSMNYRLAGRSTNTPYVDQPADVEDAVAWIRANAAALNVDPDRIALVGASAGAHLAMMHATTSTSQPVRTVVSFAGPTDLRLLSALPVISGFVGHHIGNCSILDCPERYASSSPVSHASPATPPMMLAQGMLDVYVPFTQAHQMADQLRANGVSVEVTTCLCTHGSVLSQWPAAVDYLQQQLASPGS